MKKLLLVLSLSICLLACAACGQDNGAAEQNAPEATVEEPAASETITVVDHAGNTVTLSADIERVVCLDILPLPSVLTVFFNSGDKIVGMAGASMAAAENGLLGELYPELLDADTDFCNAAGDTVNLEALLELDPDVIFYFANNTQLGEQLTNAGLPAVGVSVNKWDYNCIETLNQWIALLSQIFPADDKAQVVADYSNSVYDMVQERVAGLDDAERARVLYLFQYTDANITTSGKLFFGEWWAEAVGAVNVAGELTEDNSAVVSMEQIYSWNPDMVFLTNFTAAQPDDLYNNSIGSYDWSGISAVQKQQVYKLPLGMYRSYTPGVDTPMTLLWLAQTVYPELFADVDLTAEVQNYYQEVFGVTLTEEQVNGIYTPSSAAARGADTISN